MPARPGPWSRRGSRSTSRRSGRRTTSSTSSTAPSRSIPTGRRCAGRPRSRSERRARLTTAAGSAARTARRGTGSPSCRSACGISASARGRRHASSGGPARSGSSATWQRWPPARRPRRSTRSRSRTRRPSSSTTSAPRIATVIHTSGTTANPKGAMLSHANILFNYQAVNQVIDLSEEDTFLVAPAVAHLRARGGGVPAARPRRDRGLRRAAHRAVGPEHGRRAADGDGRRAALHAGASMAGFVDGGSRIPEPAAHLPLGRGLAAEVRQPSGRGRPTRRCSPSS